MKEAVKTLKRIQKEQRDLEIYKEFVALSQNPDSMQTEIKAQLAKKYGYGFSRNIYPVIRRVKKRLVQQANMQMV